MTHYFLVYFILIVMLVLLSVSIAIGRNMGRVQIKKHPQNKLEIIGVAESAVFGLLALLIAFTFSGAYDRFESRKMHLIEEANVFDRAYNYIDLMPTDRQQDLREDIRQYFDLYITIFDHTSSESLIKKDLEQAEILEMKIWKTAVLACDEISNKSLAQVYLPAFNDMFDQAHTGYYITQIHPPVIIFGLLIALAILGAFLVGYTSAESRHDWPLHSICYVLLTAFTIYIIINMEYPRLGFIGLNTFDNILGMVRSNMG